MAVAIIAGKFDHTTNPHPTDLQMKSTANGCGIADIGWLRDIPNTVTLSHCDSVTV